MKSVLFRTDSGAALGSGHLVRCLALAQQFAAMGVTVHFACKDMPGALLQQPRQAGHVLHVLPAGEMDSDADARLCQQLVLQHGCSLVVVDHYQLDARWESTLRATAGAVLVIDDLANRPHDCQWLLDQNDCHATAVRYQGLLPDDCQCLLGPHHALLRPEFARLRQQVGVRQGRLQRLLVFMSASDAGNETAKVLRGLQVLGRQDWQLDVVIGDAHPEPAAIAALCHNNGWQLHCQISYMADLMAAADLCIGAASSASWERCVLGLPSLVVELADNQQQVMRSLVQRGCVLALGKADVLQESDYAAALSGITPAMLVAMSQAAWQWVDGAGAARVAGHVFELIREK